MIWLPTAQDAKTPKNTEAERICCLVKSSSKAIFRGDIQGLRAIAVGLVVLYHLWPGKLAGGFIGVDVFFVISGFLITSHLVKNPPASLRELGNFWIRRVKRLLPASFLVLGSTLLGIRLLAPETVWRDWGYQVLAATFYVENWSLAAASVDYLATDNAPSAVQHFWSLSVEEQFYLLWPLIIGGLFIVGTITRKKGLFTPCVGVMLFLFASLAYSVYLTNTEPGVAYFSTLARGWELAVGGLIAMCLKQLSNSGNHIGLQLLVGSVWHRSSARQLHMTVQYLSQVSPQLFLFWAPPQLFGRLPRPCHHQPVF